MSRLQSGIKRISRRALVTVLCALCAAMPYSATEVQAAERGPKGGGKDTGGTIKIGFVASLTGVGTDPSKDMENGIRLWLDDTKGKVAGKNIQLLVENDESNPATAVGKVKKLVEDDKVDVVDGFLLANIGYKVADAVEQQYHVPLVLAVSAGDDLTQRKHYNWLLRTAYTSSQSSHPFGEYVFNKLHYKRIVTVGMDYPFGYETVGGFQQSFEKAGGQVIQKLWAPLGFRDFSSQLAKLRRDADAVFICTTSAAAEIFPKQYKEAGLKQPLLGNNSSFDEVILPHLGDDAIGAITASHYSLALNSPANKKFIAEYQAKYKTDPSSYAEDAFTSGLFIQRAIEMCGGDVSDKERFLAALRSVQLKDSPRGPIRLDDHFNPIQDVYVRQVKKEHGKVQNSVIATFKDVSQFWKWNPVEYLSQPPYSKEFPPCKYCLPETP